MIEITPYNSEWPSIYTIEAKKISKILGSNFIATHHIGSTSVPGLCAKPKIDIIIVVNNLYESIDKLEELHYRYKGEENIPMHLYLRKKEDKYGVNLHVYERDNSEIELNLTFRDHLRNFPIDCQEYAKLKTKLLAQEELHIKTQIGFSGYNLSKNNFIQSILNKAGFKSLCIKFCTHYEEWNRYGEIYKQWVGSTLNKKESLDNAIFHFVLYKDTTVITIARVKNTDNKDIIDFIFTDKAKTTKDYNSTMLSLLKKWSDSKQRQIEWL